ncbi:MAG: hypothetical protein RJB66_1758 [Pseudomonadota bacterium]
MNHIARRGKQFLLILGVLIGTATNALWAAGFSYQGRVFNAQNSPLTANNVEFTMSVRGPLNLSRPCVLYSEKFNVDMRSGDGSFSLIAGDGQRMDPSQVSLEKIFSPTLTFPNLAQCEGGYSKAAGDRLYLQVSFNDGSGLQNLDPVEITPSPYALDTFNVGGVQSASVLRLTDGPAAPFTLATFNDLLAAASGSSTKYYSSSGIATLQLKDSSGTKKISLSAPTALGSDLQLTLPSNAGTAGQVLTTNGSGTLSWSTVTSGGGGSGSSSGSVGGDLSGTLPNPTVARINGQPVSATAPSSGQILRWDGSAYAPTNFGVSHLLSSTGSSQFPNSACTAAQTLTWTSLTDTLTCTNITGLDANTITSGTIDGVRLPSSAKLWNEGTSGAISYSGGNVGIGTTSPAHKFHFVGGESLLEIDGTAQGHGTGQIYLTANAGYGAIWLRKADGTRVIRLENAGPNRLMGTTNADFVFGTNNTEQMRIATTGNVGIGTTTPTSRLNVAGAIVSEPTTVAAATVDLSTSNTHLVATPGGSTITLQNMVHGGTYTIIVQDTTSRTYTFGGCTSSYFKPANAATTSGTQTMYGIVVVKNGANWLCYITWGSGFQ